MVRFLQFLLLVLLARFAWRAASQWLSAGSGQGRADEANGPADELGAIHRGLMVRDPVCGLHVPEDRAIAVTLDGVQHHFCSDECRKAFQAAS